MEWWLEKKRQRSYILAVLAKIDKLLRNMCRLKFYTARCVLCTRIHFLFSLVQNYLVMCCATRNWHMLLYFLQNKKINTYNLEVYLMCWNLKTCSEKLKTIAFYGWHLRKNLTSFRYIDDKVRHKACEYPFLLHT